MIEIDNPEDLRIIEFTKTRDSVLNKQNTIIAESEKVFLQFLSSKKEILKILCTKNFALKHKLNHENLFIANEHILEKIAGFKLEFEIIFSAIKPSDYELSHLDDKIILLNGLSSPENVGSIVRSAAAFNVNSIITDEKTCSPFLRRCIRVSMGNIFSMKTHHSKNIIQTISELKNLNYCIISTANLETSIDVSKFDFPQKTVLIIGSEGHGIQKEVLNISDKVLKIKINEQVAHLNASNAASIFLSKL